MAYLVLVRHGLSEWNALGLWSGWTDVPLSKDGIKEAKSAAKHLEDIEIHVAHTSKLKRAKQTLAEIKKALKLTEIPTTEHIALNERDYGDYTGKNKWEIKEKIGETEFNNLRRNWDHPVPNGETLKDVHARVIPYFEEKILADIKNGKNVIVAAHGNSLRALIKHLEKIEDKRISEVEIGTAEVHIYEINEDGKIISKEIRGKKENNV